MEEGITEKFAAEKFTASVLRERCVRLQRAERIVT
jgi:hypothetical protein